MKHDETLDIGQALAGDFALTALQITVVEGPDKGKQLICQQRRNLIGTGEGCNLVLQDGTVSRNHLEIYLEPDGFTMTDLQSKNGTFLGGLRLGQAHGSQKLTLRLGATTLLMEPLGLNKPEPLAPTAAFGEVLGQSDCMRHLFAQLNTLAKSDSHILLEGETGTGKELLARAIHDASARHQQPYVILDCATLPPTLAQRELFGHRRGAFTDAKEDSAGYFEQADRGTLFVDEVGELPLEIQPLFLRAIQEGEVNRLGDTKPTIARPRLIFATHRNLQQAINNGTFRADLFYRISVAHLEVPALRQRPDDLNLLAQHFLLAISKEAGQPMSSQTAKQILEKQQAKLMSYSWPGNVRELKNWCERLYMRSLDPLALQKSLSIELSRLESSTLHSWIAGVLAKGHSFRQAKELAIAQFESNFLKNLLTQSNGNVSEAARRAQMDRRNFQKLLQKYEL